MGCSNVETEIPDKVSSHAYLHQNGAIQTCCLLFFFALYWRDWLPPSAKKAVGKLGYFYLLQQGFMIKFLIPLL